MHLKNFILDLAGNENLKKFFPSVGDEQWEALKAEASLSTARIYTEHSPPSGWNDQAYGVRVSYYNNNQGAEQPVKILPLSGGGYLVLNYSAQVGMFSPDWVFRGYLPFGRFADPTVVSDGYRYLYGGDINADNTKLALVCYGSHMVRVFNYTTGAVLWTFGDGTRGNAENGRLYNPYDAVWLPNGNLLVSSYNGTGAVATGSNSYGFVAELDGTTGALVAVRLEYGANYGYNKRGECMYPAGLGVWDNKVYVCGIGRDEVGRFNVESGAFDFEITYKKPLELTADAVNPTAVCKGPDNTIVVYSSGLKMLAALDARPSESAC